MVNVATIATMTANPVNPPSQQLLEAGTLWDKVKERTQHALQCGALLPILTHYELLPEAGVSFLVRIVANIARKEADHHRQEQRSATGKPVNPFLPYEPDLFVTDLSDTHLVLLNKFNVMDYHLLIITRAFEEQESLLTLADLEALWQCLAEFDGLAFYNSGKLAGASQRHKHLQLVPLPMEPGLPRFPMEPLLSTATFQDGIGTVPALPFVHGLVQFDSAALRSPAMAAQTSREAYLRLLHHVGLKSQPDGCLSGAYNLLVSREWMMLVPRSQESIATISINSLGFAGAILVRSREQLIALQELGPMTALSQVGVARSQ